MIFPSFPSSWWLRTFWTTLVLQAASLLEPVDRNRDSLIEEWRSRIYARSMWWINWTAVSSSKLVVCLCSSCGFSTNIVTWCWLPSRLFCIKEKSIYATLNLFEGNMNLRASCWYPEEDWMEVDLSCGFNWFKIFGGFPQLLQDEDRIRATCIQNSSSQHGHSSAMLVPDKTAPKKSPPTYIKVNEFTAIFQAWNM